MRVQLSEMFDGPLQVDGLRELKEELKKQSSNLNIKIRNVQVGDGGWVNIEYEGEDVEVFTETLRRRYGLAPVQHSRVESGDSYRGFIKDSEKTGEGILLDIGITSPKREYCVYPVSRLRAQLVDGSPQSLKKIREMFCLYEGLPLNVRVEKIEGSGRICVALTDRQEETLKEWRIKPPDRIIVIGEVPSRVLRAIGETCLGEEILGLVRLSLSTSVLECRLGTDVQNITLRLRPKLSTGKIRTFTPTIDFKKEAESL
ncbi:MAG: DUF2110 family protein [Candidatus Bathyarchaeia archaeon]